MAIISNITKKGLTAVSAELDNIKFNNILRSGYNSSVPYILANSPWLQLDINTPIKYSVNAVDINWNEAEIEEGVFITTTGELLSWIKNHSSNNSGELSDYATKNYVDGKIEDLIGTAPEALDTLKEIADKLGDNDDAVSAITNQIATKANTEEVYSKEEIDSKINELNETDSVLAALISEQSAPENVYTKDEVDAELNQLREENAALLERIQKLETIISNLDPNVPQEPGDESYSVIIPSSNEPLTPEEIAASINPEATKPETAQFMDMTELSNPTDTYLVYPLSWEIIENDQIVSPVIKDWNGFEIGFNINEDTPIVMVNDVEYRVSDIKLGKGQYTIKFK